jgi:hypothetical protein
VPVSNSVTTVNQGLSDPSGLIDRQLAGWLAGWLAGCPVGWQNSTMFFRWLQGGRNLLAGHTLQSSELDCRRPAAPPHQ